MSSFQKCLPRIERPHAPPSLPCTASSPPHLPTLSRSTATFTSSTSNFILSRRPLRPPPPPPRSTRLHPRSVLVLPARLLPCDPHTDGLFSVLRHSANIGFFDHWRAAVTFCLRPPHPQMATTTMLGVASEITIRALDGDQGARGDGSKDTHATEISQDAYPTAMTRGYGAAASTAALGYYLCTAATLVCILGRVETIT